MLCGLAVAAPALGSGGGLPHPNRAQTKWISALVDRYVKDVVLRENLADGWTISGPQMRGGVSRESFIAGNVPVPHLPLIGHSWANAWAATCHGYTDCGVRNEWGLDVYFRIGRGQNAEVWDDQMTLDRLHGKWVVTALYNKAVTRLGRGHNGSCATSKCKITGLGDFSAGSPGGGDGGPLPTVGGGRLLYVLVGTLIGIPLAVLAGYLLYVRSRNRRAWADYVAHSNRAA